MKNKYGVFQFFGNFYYIVQIQFGSPIKIFRYDNKKEYVNQNFSKFLKDNGIIHELTCANTPQHNMAAQKKKCDLEVSFTLSNVCS